LRAVGELGDAGTFTFWNIEAQRDGRLPRDGRSALKSTKCGPCACASDSTDELKLPHSLVGLVVLVKPVAIDGCLSGAWCVCPPCHCSVGVRTCCGGAFGSVTCVWASSMCLPCQHRASRLLQLAYAKTARLTSHLNGLPHPR
jgi:hypothetical protein